MRKKTINDEYYLIGYEKDGKNYYILEPYYQKSGGGTVLFGYRLAMFSKEEAIEKCRKLNIEKSETDEHLYVYKRQARYYDERISL